MIRLCAALLGAFLVAPCLHGQVPGQPVTASSKPETPTIELRPLDWDANEKEATPAAGQLTADFVFKATNSNDKPVTVLNVVTSCGCTVAKIPSTPWVVAPHSNGDMTISVNLAGKSGEFSKTITVNYEGLNPQLLMVNVQMPESPEALRQRNLQLAMADRQMVFKGECASCHSAKAEGKLAKELFENSCAICHEANPRASMVPNLHALSHPTDYDFWKNRIMIGIPGTLMPAFSQQAGGPLTDEQIDSLAKTLVKMFPNNPAAGGASASTNATAALKATPPSLPK